MEKLLKKSRALKGEIFVDADKSISHRAVILSALAQGEGIVRNFLIADDTMSSCNCIKQLGINIKQESSLLQISGKGLRGLKEAAAVLDCGNSGTTMRMLTGVLAAQPFFSILSGDESLNRRPMKRVIQPLLSMGADINGRGNGNFPPLAIKGGNLRGIEYSLPVASAQVKSALLLAGLTADSEMVLIEPGKSRDHTERMLSAMGAGIKTDKSVITLEPGKELLPQDFLVPGDISSAAFFIVAAAIVPGSELFIKNVGMNPTRAGIIEVLKKMGAKIKIENEKLIAGELIADIFVSSSDLKGITVEGDLIPRLIDELPVIAVSMAVADGQSVVKDAAELRVKETDRIAAVCSQLCKLGVDIKEMEDGFIINGNPESLQGERVDCFGDHRIAMSLAVASLVANGETLIANPEAVSISFPNFWGILSKITT